MVPDPAFSENEVLKPLHEVLSFRDLDLKVPILSVQDKKNLHHLLDILKFDFAKFAGEHECLLNHHMIFACGDLPTSFAEGNVEVLCLDGEVIRTFFLFYPANNHGVLISPSSEEIRVPDLCADIKLERSNDFFIPKEK